MFSICRVHVVDQGGEPQDLRRRGRVGLDVAQQVSPVLQDLESGAEVDELGGHVLPADVLELDLTLELVGESAEREHRVVEPLRRDAQGQRARTLVAGRGLEHEPSGRARDLRDARDALGERAVGDHDADAPVADDLREIALLRRNLPDPRPGRIQMPPLTLQPDAIEAERRH